MNGPKHLSNEPVRFYLKIRSLFDVDDKNVEFYIK